MKNSTSEFNIFSQCPWAIPQRQGSWVYIGAVARCDGSGAYIEENDDVASNLTFHNLVPNGTYSVRSHRVTMPQDYNYLFTPVGPSDGSQNVSNADADGNGMFSLMLKALPLSTNITYKDYVAMYITKQVPICTRITWTLIAVAYHSDGKTMAPRLANWAKRLACSK